MSTYSFMDTQCTLTSAEGVVDLGYGAAIADEGMRGHYGAEVGRTLFGEFDNTNVKLRAKARAAERGKQ